MKCVPTKLYSGFESSLALSREEKAKIANNRVFERSFMQRSLWGLIIEKRGLIVSNWVVFGNSLLSRNFCGNDGKTGGDIQRVFAPKKRDLDAEICLI